MKIKLYPNACLSYKVFTRNLVAPEFAVFLGSPSSFWCSWLYSYVGKGYSEIKHSGEILNPQFFLLGYSNRLRLYSLVSVCLLSLSIPPPRSGFAFSVQLCTMEEWALWSASFSGFPCWLLVVGFHERDNGRRWEQDKRGCSISSLPLPGPFLASAAFTTTVPGSASSTFLLSRTRGVLFFWYHKSL